MSVEAKKYSLLQGLPGYPFFPCRICQSEGFSGKNNDGCDHTVFERARAVYPSLSGLSKESSNDQ